MKINQFHSGTAVGDAVTNQMLEIQNILIEEGYESEIYAQHIDQRLSKKIKNISGYVGNKDNILLVHHSMGFDLFDSIVSLPDKKALIYHNITPERFFNDEWTKSYIRLGLQETKEYRKYVQYAIADSNYNRKELIRMGFNNIDVMPVQISLNRFDNIKADEKMLVEYKKGKNILFTGRVVPNKRQSDVIKAFAIYAKYFNEEAKLLFAGDDSNYVYVEELKKMCQNLEISDKVRFLGKVSEAELKACYEVADIFLCMSEHEGFGVPLLEAMTFKVPVIAFKSSAIPETMGGAGILVSEKNFPMIGALLDEVIENKELYTRIVERQLIRIEKLESTDTKKILLKAINNILNQNRFRSIQMQGPFETSYSLAIVNRKLIEAIDDIGEDDVSIYCTEGPGDYMPKEADLEDKPHAKALWEKSREMLYPDITIRNMYPPRVADANGSLNFLAFGWEESTIPKKYVKDFNEHLNGIGTMSDFVTESLIKSGVTVPVKTMGLGVELISDYDSIPKYKLKTKKNIKFLHVSSAFPRKGVDILLKAYYETFSNQDDVCLVIKTFPNPHNTIIEQLNKLNCEYKNAPEVELINKDLEPRLLYGLYKAADCYVSVARGEGFGLPVAEAMLAKIPVIVSPNTGMADFCNESTAFLVDFEMEQAKTHLSTDGSQWARPNKETLSLLMKQFAEGRFKEERRTKVENAYSLISSRYTWAEVAKRWREFIKEVENMQGRPKVAMVTTWNSKCGIAEYTRLQYEAMRNMTEFHIYPNYGVKLLKADESNVEHRLWHSAFEGNLDNLSASLEESECEVIHIQFNFGFFKLDHLAELIEDLFKKKRIIITFHKTKDTDVGGKMVSLKRIASALNKCYKLVVHQEDDKKTLLGFGIAADIIEIIPLGQVEYRDEDVKYAKRRIGLKNSRILGSYGFLLPQKGILENIKALPLLKKKYEDILYLVICALHESEISREYYEACKKTVKKLGLENNVRFITEYLPNEESIKYLHACDVLLMTYLPSLESASGAVRFCVAARRPIITTEQAIFDEFADCTYQVKSNEPMELSRAIEIVLDEKTRSQYLDKIEKRIYETSWQKTSQSYLELYKEV